MNDAKLRLPLRFAWLWVLVFVVLAFTVKPAFRMVKSWRAGIFLKRAEQALARGDVAQAQEQGLLSLQLHPHQIDGIRLLARLAVMKNDPAGLNLWMHVVQSQEVADADRIALGEIALRADVPDLAQDQLAVLLSRPAPSKESYHLAGLLAVRQQKTALAREWFQKALRLDPGYARAEMNLARVELFSGERKLEMDAGNGLRRLADRKDEWGLEGLRLLAEWGSQNSSRFPYDEKLADSLRTHSMAKMRDRCLAADWEMRSHSGRAEALVASLIRSMAQASADEKRDLAAWLNRHRFFEKTLSLFPLDSHSPDPMALVQLDALAALGRWGQIRDFLAGDVLTSQPVLRSLYRARAARETGSEKLYDLGWRQAMREAEGNISAQLYLADYAEKLGEIARAAEVYETLARVPSCQLDALVKLVRLYERLGQTRNIFNVIQRLRALRPADSAVLNDEAYLGLLLNESPAESGERARQVYANDPRLPAFAVTYALSELKFGRPSEALKALQRFSASELTAPGWRAVYAAALQANGKKTEALKAVQGIEFRDLKPEEKTLIADIKPAE